MKFKSFIILYAFAVAIFVFAQRRPATAHAPQQQMFSTVVDLTHSVGGSTPAYEASEKFEARQLATYEKQGYAAREICLPEHFSTHVDAPAHFSPGRWSVDQIPAQRLVAPLVVLDVSDKRQADADYQITVEDIASWEQVNGTIPPGAVVLAHTGWEEHWSSAKAYRNADAKGTLHFPGYSLDAARFLAEGRNAFGIGIDTLSVDYGPSTAFPVHKYLAARSVYGIENVANLDRAPLAGGIVIVSPEKLENGTGSPARLLVLVR